VATNEKTRRAQDVPIQGRSIGESRRLAEGDSVARRRSARISPHPCAQIPKRTLE
jgi:hypothetical protein